MHAQDTVLAIAAREGDLVRGDCFGAVLACRTAIVAPSIEHRVVRCVADGVPMLFDAEVAVGVERGGRSRGPATGFPYTHPFPVERLTIGDLP
ncbi:hypothetical protein IU483_34325 [Streptomyces gardneri]|nr:hypothetical protein [Streptomyces gardneri]